MYIYLPMWAVFLHMASFHYFWHAFSSLHFFLHSMSRGLCLSVSILFSGQLCNYCIKYLIDCLNIGRHFSVFHTCSSLSTNVTKKFVVMIHVQCICRHHKNRYAQFHILPFAVLLTCTLFYYQRVWFTCVIHLCPWNMCVCHFYQIWRTVRCLFGFLLLFFFYSKVVHYLLYGVWTKAIFSSFLLLTSSMSLPQPSQRDWIRATQFSYMLSISIN